MNEVTNGGINANILTINFNGHIDSANAAAVEKEIFAIKDTAPDADIVIDAENLEYISSAGLRVILRIRKEKPNLKIINVSSEVYEVFEMTGFSEMIHIEKGYRKLSVDGCEVIGQGSNGKVYRLDPDTIIKVYLNPDSLPDIHRERELARKAFVMGIPTAIPYDVVKVGEGYGSVFELLNAKSFTKLINAEPENLEKYIELYVDLLKKIHSTELKPGEMPSMKEVALGWANYLKDYLAPDKSAKLISLIEAVPEDLHMMHGDYHTKNVMMQNGEVLLIDMDTLCTGHPVFEFASIFLAYCGYGELDHSITESFMGLPYDVAEKIWTRTLELYFDTTDKAKLEEYADKAKIVGYTRMMRRTIRRIGFDDPAGKALIECCEKHLNELLDKVDTLLF